MKRNQPQNLLLQPSHGILNGVDCRTQCTSDRNPPWRELYGPLCWLFVACVSQLFIEGTYRIDVNLLKIAHVRGGVIATNGGQVVVGSSNQSRRNNISACTFHNLLEEHVADLGRSNPSEGMALVQQFL